MKLSSNDGFVILGRIEWYDHELNLKLQKNMNLTLLSIMF